MSTIKLLGWFKTFFFLSNKIEEVVIVCTFLFCWGVEPRTKFLKRMGEGGGVHDRTLIFRGGNPFEGWGCNLKN